MNKTPTYLVPSSLDAHLVSLWNPTNQLPENLLDLNFPWIWLALVCSACAVVAFCDSIRTESGERNKKNNYPEGFSLGPPTRGKGEFWTTTALRWWRHQRALLPDVLLDCCKVHRILLSRYALIFGEPALRQAVASSTGLSILFHLWQWLKFRSLLFSALLPFTRIWWCLRNLRKPLVHTASCGRAKTMLRKQFLRALDFFWKATPSCYFWCCHSSPQLEWQTSLPVIVFVPFL